MGDLLFCWETTTLYRSDLTLLKPPNWLNDNVINFACDYYEHVVFKPHQDKMKFVPPGTSFVIKHENDPEDLMDTLKGSGIMGKEVVFFPVSNAAVGGGGSHWSLLCFVAREGKFYSFDSSSNSNTRSALQLAKQVAGALVPGFKSSDFVTVATPQQANAYDCGVYCVAVMRWLAARAAVGGAVHGAECEGAMLGAITPPSVTKTREVLLGCVMEVAKNYVK